MKVLPVREVTRAYFSLRYTGYEYKKHKKKKGNREFLEIYERKRKLAQ